MQKPLKKKVMEFAFLWLENDYLLLMLMGRDVVNIEGQVPRTELEPTTRVGAKQRGGTVWSQRKKKSFKYGTKKNEFQFKFHFLNRTTLADRESFRFLYLSKDNKG